jgi:prespore-specific regulator
MIILRVVKSRKEVWSLEQDNLLLNTVLKHLAEGGNQKRAFEEVAHEIGRTPGACAFRFHAVLRQRHGEKISSVIKKKSVELSTVIQLPKNKNAIVDNLSWEQVMGFLNLHIVEEDLMKQRLIDMHNHLNDIAEENRSLKKELDYFKEVREKIESFGMNITKMMDLFK